VLKSPRQTNTKIIFVVLTWGVGFSEWERAQILEREMRLFEEYLSQGLRVGIISSSQEDFNNQLKWQTRMFRYELIFVRPKLVRSILSLLSSNVIKDFKSLHKQKLSDVAIKSNQFLGAHLAALLAFHMRCRSIIRLGHSPIDQGRIIGQSSWYLLILKAYENLLFISNAKWEFTTFQIKQNVCQRHSKKVQSSIIPNYVDSEFWKMTNLDLSINGPRKIGYFGRYTKQKNLANLIKAVAMVPDLHLTLIGEGEERHQLIDLINALGIQDRVDIRGRLHPNEIVKESALWDFAVLPSLVEGNPKFVLEMFCMEIMVVATNAPGINDLIEDGKTGILANSETVFDLFKAIERALNISKSDKRRICLNAKNIVEENNSVESVARKQIEFYFQNSKV
jgi:glycosyltransferase involved in cell wall biosynthesis